MEVDKKDKILKSEMWTLLDGIIDKRFCLMKINKVKGNKSKIT